jgi:hypothetical protein
MWEKPVFRLPDQVLDSVIYLYQSAADAEAGEAVGGTGFLVGVPTTLGENLYFIYAVTVSHVINEGQSPVIRLNTKDGDKDVIDVSASDWVHHQDGDDLAVCGLELGTEKYQWAFAEPAMFLTPNIVAEHNIGPGDEVFMAGRFVTHEGRQRNTPTARFGNISMLPAEPIAHPSRGIDQESFLVEMRSLAGFSGSPVFVNVERNKPRGIRNGSVFHATRNETWLLGIDWAHFPIYENVKERNRRDDVPEGWVVESNSGQMAVVPAWRSQDLLNQQELAEKRTASEERIRKQQDAQNPETHT